MLPSLSSVICEQTLQQRHGAPRAWKCNAGVSVFQCWFYLLTFVLTSAVWLEYYLVRAELKHFCCINPALGNMTLKATYNHVHALSEPPCVMHWENPVIWKHNAAEKQKHKWWIFNGLFSLACLTGFLVMALLFKEEQFSKDTPFLSWREAAVNTGECTQADSNQWCVSQKSSSHVFVPLFSIGLFSKSQVLLLKRIGILSFM